MDGDETDTFFHRTGFSGLEEQFAAFGKTPFQAGPDDGRGFRALCGVDHEAEAVHAAVDTGLSFGAVTEGETLIAEEVIKIMPNVEAVRFVSSGTEAGMYWERAIIGIVLLAVLLIQALMNQEEIRGLIKKYRFREG